MIYELLSGMTQSDSKSRKGQPSKRTHLKWDSLEATKKTKSSNLWECVGVFQCFLFVSPSPEHVNTTAPDVNVFYKRLCFFVFRCVYKISSSLPSSRLFLETSTSEKRKNPDGCTLIMSVSLAAFSATTLRSHPAHFLSPNFSFITFSCSSTPLFFPLPLTLEEIKVE